MAIVVCLKTEFMHFRLRCHTYCRWKQKGIQNMSSFAGAFPKIFGIEKYYSEDQSMRDKLKPISDTIMLL